MQNRSKVGLIVLFLIMLLSGTVSAQSKIYLAGGVSSVMGSGVNILLGSDSYGVKFDNYAFDFEYQRRIIGSFNLVTGASVFNAGYSTTDASFSAASTFREIFATIPLMARWNPLNKSFYYVDFGFEPYFLLNAHLEERIVQFGKNYVVKGDITDYTQRFYVGFKVQWLVPVNRFYFGGYVRIPFRGQSTLKGLDNHWGLNAQQSTYLLSNGFSDFVCIGFKAGVRIK